MEKIRFGFVCDRILRVEEADSLRLLVLTAASVACLFEALWSTYMRYSGESNLWVIVGIISLYTGGQAMFAVIKTLYERIPKQGS